MKKVYFTINVSGNFNCSAEVEGEMSKGKLKRLINKGKIHPHIEGENYYNFHASTLQIERVEDEEQS